MNHYAVARQAEISYHEALYEETELFQEGTWLSRPASRVMELLSLLNPIGLRVLDLGCGIGRHSIPIAQQIQSFGGTVLGVDLLPIAVNKMLHYAKQYGVQEAVLGEVADIEHYKLQLESYDYIVACSCLEHVSDIDAFQKVIAQMIDGTRDNGMIVILMSTDVKEIEVETGNVIEGLIELNLNTEQAIHLLHDYFHDWEILRQDYKLQSIEEQKAGKAVLFQSNWLTFAARKGIAVSNTPVSKVYPLST